MKAQSEKECIMSKNTVVILQETNEAIDKVKAVFTEEEDFEIIGSTTDGISAITFSLSL